MNHAGAPKPPPESGGLDNLRWRTYQFIFIIVSLGMVPLMLSGRSLGWQTASTLGAISLSFALLAVAQGLLKKVSPLIEALALGVGSLLYLLRYVQVLTRVASGDLPPEALGDIFPWVGVLLAAIFVVLPYRRALVAAFAALAFVSGYGLFTLPRQGTLRGLEPMIDLTMAGVILILFLSVFRRMIEAGARAEARAATMSELALRDPLTGLHNRRYLDQKLEDEFARAERYGHPLSVAVCDIDNFKAINDRFSHAVGDETLRQLADLITSNTREVDSVARYGGEEFVILFLETPKTAAALVCEGLRKLVETHDWDALQPGLQVTVSIGLADDLSLENHEKLLHQADLALYKAKEEGRNRVRYQGAPSEPLG